MLDIGISINKINVILAEYYVYVHFSHEKIIVTILFPLTTTLSVRNLHLGVVHTHIHVCTTGSSTI